MTKPQDKPRIACMGTVRSSRLFAALLFLAVGATFVGLLAFTPVLDCNELCPEWFTGCLIAYHLLPIVWMIRGAIALSRSERLRSGITLAVINTMALVGAIVGTRHFVLP